MLVFLLFKSASINTLVSQINRQLFEDILSSIVNCWYTKFVEQKDSLKQIKVNTTCITIQVHTVSYNKQANFPIYKLHISNGPENTEYY